MKSIRTLTLIAAMLVGATSAQAVLVDNLDGTVTDNVTNLVWLQDWNFGHRGYQNWHSQIAWADGLSFAGSNQWALPTIAQYTALFAQEGDLSNPLLPFTHVQPDAYWSSTESVLGIGAWIFLPVTGFKTDDFEDFGMYGVAVRAGDVIAVAEPQGAILLLAGLTALATSRRIRSRWSYA